MKFGKGKFCREGQDVGAGDQTADFLYSQHHGDAPDKGHVGRVFQKGEIDESFDDNPKERTECHAAQKAEDQASRPLENEEAHVAPDRVDRRMGDVKDPKNAVDQGQPEGDQGIDGAHGNTVEELFQKELHGFLRRSPWQSTR